MELPGEKPLAELGRRFRPALVSYFLRRIRDLAEAEDLAHEVLIRLNDIPLDKLRSAEAYVFQVAANLLRDRLRRNKVRAEYVVVAAATVDAAPELLDPARIEAGRRSLLALVETLLGLPERTREMFVLYRIENVPKRDIAAAFDVSVSTVEKEVAKAVAHLALYREKEE